MPNPIVDSFVEEYSKLQSDSQRDEFARLAVQQIENSGSDAITSFNNVVGIGQAVNRDFTGLMSAFQRQPVPPVPLSEVEAGIETARDQAPWYKKAAANALGAIDTYQKQVVEPTAANVLNTALRLTPGTQPLERNIEVAQAAMAAERGIQLSQLSMLDRFKASGEAWRNTDMVWGMKGSMEILFDPLNLVGLGIPGKIATAAPALRPLMLPLQAVDQLPNKLVDRGLSATGRLAKTLPGVSRLTEPAEATRLFQIRNQVQAETRNLFGVAGLQSNNPAITRELLSSGMQRFPEDAGPYSVRNVFNHLEDIMDDGKLVKLADGSDGTKFDQFLDDLSSKPPDKAAELLADTVVLFERKAIRQGGKRITGEVLEGTKSQRRQAAITQSVSRRLGQDERWGRAIAKAVDGVLNKFETTWIQKIEPTVVRPWTLSHLAFAGYMPFNLIEDIGFAVVGMGVNPTGFSDDMFRLTTTGLPGDALPPAFLTRTEKGVQDTSMLALGLYEQGERTEQLATRIVQSLGIKKSGQIGFGIQRQAWGKAYWREFEKVLRENGVSAAEINTLRDFIRTELPTSLQELGEQITMPVWMAASTGDSNAVRQLAEITTPERLRQNAQIEVMKEFSHLPPDVRSDLFREIIDGGGVTQDKFDDIINRARDRVIDWHRLSGEGMRQQFGSALEAIGQRQISSGSEAASMMRWMQWAGDALGDLPRELSARAGQVANTVAPGQRGKVFEDLRSTIVEDVGAIRETYEAMIDRARPKVQAALAADEAITRSTSGLTGGSVARAVDNYFDSQVAVARNAQDAAERIRALADEAFSSTPPEERNGAFWTQFRQDVGSIWDDELETRIGLLQDGRDAWLSVFEGVRPSQLNPKEREFMRKGIDAALGDTDQRLDELRIALTKLDDRLATISDTSRPALEQRIQTVKTRIRTAFDHRQRLLKRQDEFLEGGRRTVTPSSIREVERGINAQRKAITLAEQQGMTELVPNMRAILDQATSERERLIRELVPPDVRKQYDNLIQQRDAATDPRARNRAQASVNRFEDQIKRGETIREAGQVGPVSLRAQREAALAALESNGNILPNTLEDFEAILIDLNNQGDPRVAELVRELSDDVDFAEEVLERAYSHAAGFASRPQLTASQLSTLDKISKNGPNGLFPTRQLVELSESGLVTPPRSIAGTGRVEVALTEQGEELLSGIPVGDLDIQDILDSLDSPGREFVSTIDNMMSEVTDATDRLVKIGDNPPMSTSQANEAQRYYNRVADQMDRTPDMLGEFRNARSEAGRRATKEFRHNFIDYDNRTTGDFIMQRFFPFWMYASRRFPRLIRLAGKRPVLGKYFTQVAFDWDFGFVPTPWGDEFNPHKATLVGGLRRTASRDFPELHTGFRGGIEEGLDWLGRFGLNPLPPATAAINLLNGEPAASVPPPLSLILHGVEATGNALPAPLDELAFDSRFAQFQMDQVMAQTFEQDPQDIRRRAELGDEDAMAMMQVARMEAARVMIRGSQAAVFRYRPSGKREFVGTTEQLVEDSIGIPVEQQETFRRLGIPLSSMVPISKFQRRVIRETLGDDKYEAWINSTWALRPQEEQTARGRVDEFWFEAAKLDEAHEAVLEDLSRRWQEGFLSGPEYREELSSAKRERAYAFDALQQQDRFRLVAGGIGVPITMEQRAQWQEKFNSPAPLIHPVDEVLERYHGVDVEKYRDPLSGAVTWDLFFGEQERILAEAPEPIRSIAEQELAARVRTPAERALELSREKMRAYYGVRDELMNFLSESNPQLAEAYKLQRRLANAAKLAPNVDDRAYYEQQAIEMMARNPELTILERLVRDQRAQLRASDPEMEAVFQMWISTPTVSGGGGLRIGRSSRRSPRR